MKSISTTILRNMIIVAFIAIAGIGSLWITQEYLRFTNEAEEVRLKETAFRKTLLKSQVNNAVDYINFKRLQTEERVNKHIKERVYEAHKLATHIYNLHKDEKTKPELEVLVREALRQIIFNEGRGYFFAMSLQGDVKLFTDKPELEGGNLLNAQDPQGNFVNQDMLNIINRQGEGFYSYQWTKPGQQGNNFRKVSFIKLFKPFNWLIGTGEYVDDMEEQIQQEVISRINQIKFGREGYVFAGQWDGIVLSGPARGKNMYDIVDPNGVRIVRKLIESAKDGGGFVSYVMPKLANQKPEPKLSYATGIKEWQWYVGAGEYVDDIEQDALLAKQKALQTVKQQVVQILFFLLILVVFTVLISLKTMQRNKQSFQTLFNFFKKASSQSVAIDPDKLEFEEFQQLAVSANKMLADRQQMETELRQSQKMESIGTLAGGIAHDFNNILSAIFGYSDLALLEINDKKALEKNIGEIKVAAERAKNLVKQILTFSRSAEEKKHPLQISIIAKEALKLLRSSIPVTIEIKQAISSKELITADSTQIHQIIMNLCTNAYHAMREQGGTLSIILEDIELTEQELTDLDLPVGLYVHLAISDTGVGMSAKTQEKIFDPYFTTKEVGDGTGLGLAVVHGIIQSHKGKITVISELGKGTTFHIYFPIAEGENESILAETPETPIAGGYENIILVDDDRDIIRSTMELLKAHGYTVSPYTNGVQAFQDFQLQPDKFDLLITDMTMPYMTGSQLAQKIMEIRPNFPIILCTGHSDLTNREKSLSMGIKEYCEKPLSVSTLLRSVRKVLDDSKVSDS